MLGLKPQVRPSVSVRRAFYSTILNFLYFCSIFLLFESSEVFLQLTIKCRLLYFILRTHIHTQTRVWHEMIMTRRVATDHKMRTNNNFLWMQFLFVLYCLKQQPQHHEKEWKIISLMNSSDKTYLKVFYMGGAFSECLL